jgi:hypothetical protein
MGWLGSFMCKFTSAKRQAGPERMLEHSAGRPAERVGRAAAAQRRGAQILLHPLATACARAKAELPNLNFDPGLVAPGMELFSTDAYLHPDIL